jgi:hypothetical protein
MSTITVKDAQNIYGVSCQTSILQKELENCNKIDPLVLQILKNNTAFCAKVYYKPDTHLELKKIQDMTVIACDKNQFNCEVKVSSFSLPKLIEDDEINYISVVPCKIS